MSEKTFPKGMMFYSRKDNQPEFVRGRLAIKVDEFKQFLDEHEKGGWVNIDILNSKQNKIYLALNDFEPKQDNSGVL